MIPLLLTDELAASDDVTQKELRMRRSDITVIHMLSITSIIYCQLIAPVIKYQSQNFGAGVESVNSNNVKRLKPKIGSSLNIVKIVLNFENDRQNDKRNVSCKFHQNSRWERIFSTPGVSFPCQNFKSTFPNRILLKFAGKVSFIIVMIIYKFQDDCATKTDFSIFSQ